MSTTTIDPVAVTLALAAIDSTTGQEAAAMAHMAALLVERGWHVQRQPVGDPALGRTNLYATREPPVVVLSTHLDCVPPFIPPREDETHLRGRGVCDAKGIAAAMLAAAEQLAAEGERRVGLLFLVGEENGSDGAKAAASLEPKGRYLVNGEPTDGQLTVGQKGALRVDIVAEGRAAHSGYPDEGRSAVVPLLETLRRVRRLPLPFDPMLGSATLNIGVLEAGVAPNVIPPSARAQILIRTVGPTDGLRRQLLACGEAGVQITFPLEIPAVRSAPPVGWRTTVVSFASDLPFLADWGTGYQLGPGSIRVAHTDDEHLAKDDLHKGVELYVALARHLIAA